MRKQFKMRLYRFALLLSALLPIHGAATAPFDTSFSGPFEAAVGEAMGREHIPGLAVSVVHAGKEVYAHAFGVRDVVTGAPLATTDLFHWASVTKPFVATAAMQLVEAGTLDLDAPVTEYLPYFRMNDSAYNKITSRLLLTHTAGMPDVWNYEWHKPQYDDGALERWVRSVGRRKLKFSPASREKYSNIGFEVMGDVIAKVSGIPFEEYVAKNVFEPLGMDSATLLVKNTDPKDRVSPHTGGRGGPVVRKHWPYNRRHAPSSTLIANVHDLGRWAIANLNRGTLDGTRILKEEAYTQLWEPTVDVAPKRGLSWQFGNFEGHDTVQHRGGDKGFRTALILLPDLNLGVAIASNTDKITISTFQDLALRGAIAAQSG
jgi:CubicO group peptidase (beta-lactamase class C family)